ncbi:MAG: cytochrome C [Desulfobacteraceae bacterium]|nr:MAG: cytochrome C [Desulfobacteraceae bacterium]
MKKTSAALFICTVILTALALTAAFAKNMGADQIVINGGSSGKVPFPHHLHQQVIEDCMVCHKDFSQQAGSLDAAKKSGDLKSKQVMNKTCLKCHRSMKKAKQKTGPTSCKQCHKK